VDLAVPVTGTQASRILGIKRSTLLTWVERGNLTPIGRTRQSPIFLLTDVLAAERATRSSPKSTRHAHTLAA